MRSPCGRCAWCAAPESLESPCHTPRPLTSRAALAGLTARWPAPTRLQIHFRNLSAAAAELSAAPGGSWRGIERLEMTVAAYGGDLEVALGSDQLFWAHVKRLCGRRLAALKFVCPPAGPALGGVPPARLLVPWLQELDLELAPDQRGPSTGPGADLTQEELKLSAMIGSLVGLRRLRLTGGGAAAGAALESALPLLTALTRLAVTPSWNLRLEACSRLAELVWEGCARGHSRQYTAALEACQEPLVALTRMDFLGLSEARLIGGPFLLHALGRVCPNLVELSTPGRPFSNEL
ncbi:MAG: hypothetical protein J3K34DRAFT_461842, partial [Monoraphidium minutum]